ncbi:phospholipase D family protein [Hyalangium sp.]|uniref:phospholipase D family protein n=1 Tax=Hyalangium sp. TaxID=2028555 RepID=UPI002D40D2CF|nr:phospholipase D family protein [Hyalangium sp.]HYI00610.1 phospholipase D family protein [Hyalangium sp.]
MKKLVNLDVRVRSNADLHAKVYVFDRVAFVGSANASESSSRLEEAAVILSKPAEVASARAFVNALWHGGSPTDLRILTHLARLEPKRASVPRQPVSHPLWISGVCPGKTSALVDKLQEDATRQFVADEEVPSESVVEWTTLSRRNYRVIPEQDWIYVWWAPSPGSPRGRLAGPLRCLGGIDLGKRAGDERYSRAEHAVGSKSFALDAAGLKLLARLTPRVRKADGSLAFAQHLHERLAREDIRLTDPEDLRAFARMVERLT